jgi:formyl-CoA transferase
MNDTAQPDQGAPHLDREPPTGPLAGLRIVELGSIIAGPLAGRMLADLGAEVIKVESPAKPDPMRQWGQGTHNGRKAWWPVIARNKRLVTLDLASERGAEELLRLVADSDAVIENFRPGTLEKWDLGFERLNSARPGLILVRVSGYGQTGPYADRPGFAAAAEAMSGLRFVNGYPGEIPPRMGISLGDSLASLFAVQGLLAAVYRRSADPEAAREGEVVDVSILEACLALTESIVPEYDLMGRVRGPSGARLEGIAPSNVFRSRDQRMVVIAANQDTLFTRLCTAMGRPELASDPRFRTHEDRGANQELIEAEIQAWAGEHDAAEIDDLLAAAGVVCGPVASVADVVDNPQLQARDALVEQHDEELGSFRAPGIVPRFSRGSGEVRWSGRWEPGADNDRLLAREIA